MLHPSNPYLPFACWRELPTLFCMMHRCLGMQQGWGVHTGSCMDARHPSYTCRHTVWPSTRIPRLGAPPPPHRHRLQVSAAIKKRSEKNVVCVKVLHAKPQHVGDVHKLCEQLVASVQPAKSDRASGLLSFECSNDRWDSNVFHFWERYESNQALGRFNTRDDIKNFMTHVQRYLEQPVGMALYEWRDGTLGPLCVQGGASHLCV